MFEITEDIFHSFSLFENCNISLGTILILILLSSLLI